MSKKLYVTFLDFDERNKQVKQLKRETRAVQSHIVFFDRSEERQKYWWIPAHAQVPALVTTVCFPALGTGCLLT